MSKATKNRIKKYKRGTASIANTVYATTEYGIFTKLLGNRDLRNYHVKNLKESMYEKQIEAPIIVNELYQVINGQHRLESCKKLNVPVYYIIIPGLRLEDVQRLHANSKNWSLSEHLNSFCVRGFKEYLTYRDFVKTFKFNNNEAIAILEGVSDSRKTRLLWTKFKAGKFKVANIDIAWESAEKIIEIKQYYEGYKRRSFVFALLVCFEHKSYDHKVFVKKLSKQSAKLTDQVHQDDYLRIIQKIYNRRNANPIKLFY